MKETEAMRVLITLNTGFILNGGLVWGPNLLRLFIMMLRPGQTVYWPWSEPGDALPSWDLHTTSLDKGSLRLREVSLLLGS